MAEVYELSLCKIYVCDSLTCTSVVMRPDKVQEFIFPNSEFEMSTILTTFDKQFSGDEFKRICKKKHINVGIIAPSPPPHWVLM